MNYLSKIFVGAIINRPRAVIDRPYDVIRNTSLYWHLFRYGCHFERPQGVEKSVMPIKRTDCHGHKCPRNDKVGGDTSLNWDFFRYMGKIKKIKIKNIYEILGTKSIVA